MKNFRSNGNSVAVVAPAGGVLGGQIFRKGGLVGIVVADAVEGQTFTLKLSGEYSDVKKKAGEAWAIGDKLYCSAAHEITTTAADGEFCGHATAAALAGAVLGTILLAR